MICATSSSLVESTLFPRGITTPPIIVTLGQAPSLSRSVETKFRYGRLHNEQGHSQRVPAIHHWWRECDRTRSSGDILAMCRIRIKSRGFRRYAFHPAREVNGDVSCSSHPEGISRSGNTHSRPWRALMRAASLEWIWRSPISTSHRSIALIDKVDLPDRLRVHRRPQSETVQDHPQVISIMGEPCCSQSGSIAAGLLGCNVGGAVGSTATLEESFR